MEIYLNMLIEWVAASNDGDNKAIAIIERVIDITGDGKMIVTIHVEGKTGFPVVRPRSYICHAHENGFLRVLSVDPFLMSRKPGKPVPENHRRIRDKAYKLVDEVLREAGDEIYGKSGRGAAIRKVAAKYRTSEKVIYFYLRRYWQRGGTRDSLLPDLAKSGGKGKRRFAVNGSSVKLGRPRQSALTTGEPFGIRVTESVEKLFRYGIDSFYLNDEGRSFNAAYEKMLIAFFNIGYDLVNGIKVPVMPPLSQLPSIYQFRYWYERYYKDKKKELTARLGENEFNLKFRELMGDSTSLASGPGAVFMIDATIADVYLVSSFDRKRTIGRPVVYLIKDTFSRMIVGFSVTLEGPSWLGASLALDNMVTDKVKVCAKYGIEIRPDDWNCRHLPESIFADRGEFEGYAADILVSVFGIRIHNTPPYRGDLKGIIERHFGIVNDRFIHFLPGAVVKRRRGRKSYALDAKLTLNDFSQLLIEDILHHNNSGMSKYRPDKSLIAANVPLRPRAIWNWGIHNRSGYLRTMPRDIVRLNLLPRKTVSVGQSGIRFYKDMFYMRPDNVAFDIKKIEIAYDPNCLDEIYIPSPDGKNAVISPLVSACSTYIGKTFEEMRDMYALRKQLLDFGSFETLQSEAQFRALEEKIVSRATQRTDEAWASAENQSDRARLRNIRRDRKEEKRVERLLNPLSPGKSDLPPALPPAPDVAEQEYVVRPSRRKLLGEVIKKKQGRKEG